MFFIAVDFVSKLFLLIHIFINKYCIGALIALFLDIASCCIVDVHQVVTAKVGMMCFVIIKKDWHVAADVYCHNFHWILDMKLTINQQPLCPRSLNITRLDTVVLAMTLR